MTLNYLYSAHFSVYSCARTSLINMQIGLFIYILDQIKCSHLVCKTFLLQRKEYIFYDDSNSVWSWRPFFIFYCSCVKSRWHQLKAPKNFEPSRRGRSPSNMILMQVEFWMASWFDNNLSIVDDFFFIICMWMHARNSY